MDLGGWLRTLGLEQYEAAFRENAIDVSVLPDLTDQDLEKIGVLLGHRRKLLRAIAEPNGDVHDFDLVTFLFFYHDTTYMNVDRAVMDRKLFAALKPGGYLVIADHSALPGQGTSVGKTLHRIEESTLRQEVEAVGFRFVAEGNFWRSASDTHDFPSYRPTVPVDNFVLKFQKPE